MVNAEIQRLMIPTKKPFIVTVNYTYEVNVLAHDEDDAIDMVIDMGHEEVRVLNCNDVEVLV